MSEVQKENIELSDRWRDILEKPPSEVLVDLDGMKKLVEEMPHGVMLEVTFADGGK